MKAVTQTENEVLAVLQRFMDAYAKRDEKGFMDLFAEDPDVVLIGTGVDEKRVGAREILAQAERDWSQSEYAYFELVDYALSSAGTVAWLAADMVANAVTAGETIRFLVRQTIVFEQRDGHWKIVHIHTSMPSLQQNWGESFPEEPIFSVREGI